MKNLSKEEGSKPPREACRLRMIGFLILIIILATIIFALILIVFPSDVSLAISGQST